MSCDQSAALSCQLVVGAGEALIRAHALLLRPTPQNLDRVSSTLAMAIVHVTDLQKILIASPSTDLADALVALRKEIDGISLLLEHAAAYHANLLQSMIAASVSEVPLNRCLSSSNEPARRVSLVA